SSNTPPPLELHNTPIYESRDPVHPPPSPTRPSTDHEPRQLSTLQPSHLPLPLRSKNHSPVEGRKTPMYDLPVPVQSPATGRSPAIPNEHIQISAFQPSHLPFPFR